METHLNKLREIRERLAKATPGPWKVWRPEDDDERYIIPTRDDEKGFIAEADLRRKEVDWNALLIAHAPTDLAYLLDRVEQLERVVKAARAVYEHENYFPTHQTSNKMHLHHTLGEAIATLYEYEKETR